MARKSPAPVRLSSTECRHKGPGDENFGGDHATSSEANAHAKKGEVLKCTHGRTSLLPMTTALMILRLHARCNCRPALRSEVKVKRQSILQIFGRREDMISTLVNGRHRMMGGLGGSRYLF